MSVKRALQLLALVALAGMAPACASTNTTTGEAAPGAAKVSQVQVTVNNDLTPPASLTVWMVPRTGARKILGNVSPSQTQTFTFTPSLASEQYVLTARTTAGTDLTSTPFTLTPGTSGVTWNVQTNSVEVGG